MMPLVLISLNALLAAVLSEVEGFGMSKEILQHWDAVSFNAMLLPNEIKASHQCSTIGVFDGREFGSCIPLGVQTQSMCHAFLGSPWILGQRHTYYSKSGQWYTHVLWAFSAKP